MPLKERFAWAWLAGLIVVPTLYFLAVANQATPPPPPGPGFLRQMAVLAAALGSLAVVALAARFVVARPAADEEGLTEDERDRHIESRSTQTGYNVLMAGMILVGFVLPFSASVWEIVHAAFLAIVVAEVVRYSVVVLGYRRGTRG